MSRLNAQQAQSFPDNVGRTNFLSLQNDGDSAIVRFAYKSLGEIPIYLVHNIMRDGRSKIDRDGLDTKERLVKFFRDTENELLKYKEQDEEER